MVNVSSAGCFSAGCARASTVNNMKKTLFLAGCGLLVSSLAQAQSSVTLWGQVDSGLTYINNKKGGSSFGTASGIGSPTR